MPYAAKYGKAFVCLPFTNQPLKITQRHTCINYGTKEMWNQPNSAIWPKK